MKKSQLQQIIKEEIQKILKEAKEDIVIYEDQMITFKGKDYSVRDIINNKPRGIQDALMYKKVKYKNQDWYVDGIETETPAGYGYRTREYDKGPGVHLTKNDPNNVNTTAESNPEFDKINAAIENQLQKFGPPYSDFKKISRQSNTANYTNFYKYKVNVNGNDYYIMYTLNDKLSNLRLGIRDGEDNIVTLGIDLKDIKKKIARL